MGEEVEQQTFTREARTRYRTKVRACLDVFERMLVEARFDSDDPATGMEIELNLVDDDEQPALCSMEVLEALGDPDFQTELGRFNLEINVAPKKLPEQGVMAFGDGVRNSLNAAEQAAQEIGAHLVMVGILPTLTERHLEREVLSTNPRYQLLSNEILAARGEDIVLDLHGPERLRVTADSIAPEAACTSTQLHVQVSPEGFPAYWNASQAISSLQLVVGANSPYLVGKELWRETRIGLFEQATDTRAEELKAQGVRPRVWFGERWITSIFDLFEENVRYFPALLPVLSEEDPAAVLEGGGIPHLDELRLHNGTIYRWNRPVYAVVDGVPHVRVENRVLPSGPTVVDTLANAAFYFGLVKALAELDRPVWSQMSFTAAEENFHAAAIAGIDARVYWPGVGQVPATELVLRRLLPLAAAGLQAWGVSDQETGELLDIIERRCVSGRNGSSWLVEQVHRRGSEGDRHHVISRVMADYREHMHSNEPVHTWG
jgi:gamma-glutamyl:cysteine ligase YbdK (ATP-grasp superfamily)